MKSLDLLCLAGVALMTGCAAQSPKPEVDYASFAQTWVAIDKCGRAGLMEPSTAAFGMRQMQINLQSFSADQAKLSEATSAISARPTPSGEQCNALAMRIAARKQEIEVARSSQEPAYQPPPARNATCYTLGSQTLCNAF